MDRETLLKALNKPSPYGPDVDLSRFDIGSAEIESLEEKKVDEVSSRLGLGGGLLKRADYLQVNESVISK
ncbi:MAG: hypothetical protein ACP5KB_06070, partial [Thermoprotei archaeon]